MRAYAAQRGLYMKIIKRNGSEVDFDITKIIVAVTKANDVVPENERMTPMQIQRIAQSVELACQKVNRAMSVEEIQDLVEKQIMAHGAFEVAKQYITYRYTRSLVRKSNTTDDKILSLIECNNEEVKQENSNKNPTVNSGYHKPHSAASGNSAGSRGGYNPFSRCGLFCPAYAQLRPCKP